MVYRRSADPLFMCNKWTRQFFGIILKRNSSIFWTLHLILNLVGSDLAGLIDVLGVSNILSGPETQGEKILQRFPMHSRSYPTPLLQELPSPLALWDWTATITDGHVMANCSFAFSTATLEAKSSALCHPASNNHHSFLCSFSFV